jgi:hypothetical protein
VSTVIDGHKLNINPHSVLPRFGSSDFVVLDSAGSVFYTVYFPISQGTEIPCLVFFFFFFQKLLFRISLME